MWFLNKNNRSEYKDFDSKDGFPYRVYPASIKKVKSVVFALHGHDSSVPLMHEHYSAISRKLKDTLVIAPEAPIEVDTKDSRFGDDEKTYSWVNITDAMGILKGYFSFIYKKNLDVVSDLGQFMNNRLEDYDVPPENSAIVGHSLGGIMGFAAVFNSKASFGSFVPISTVLPSCVPVANKPTPVHYIMGKKDEIFISNEYVDPKYKLLESFRETLGLSEKATIARMGKEGLLYEHISLDDHGHEVTQEVIDMAVEAVANDLGISRRKKLQLFGK